jgi:hypothetical protein
MAPNNGFAKSAYPELMSGLENQILTLSVLFRSRHIFKASSA